MSVLPTSNVMQRTFCIRYGESLGTCFTVDVDERQYIVTARHIAESLSESGAVKIFHEGSWKELPVALVGHGSDKADVTVLAADLQLSPIHPLPAMRGEYAVGQEVLFLGFPYGLMMNDTGSANRDFPLPLVKHGIISAFQRENEASTILLDGHNNPGFSGGPVVCERKTSTGNELFVIGVVSGYRWEPEPVHEGKHATSLEYRANTGIIHAISIAHAIDMIKANPIGFKLESGRD